MTPQVTALISLLLGSFPNFQSGDSEAALLAYQYVLKDAELSDIEAGVSKLINGEYPGHDGRFAPTAPQLATVIRMAREDRERHEKRMQYRLAPPPPDEISEDERARVAEKMKALRLEKKKAITEWTADEVVAVRTYFAKVNEHFAPDMSDEAIAERLGLIRGYSVGDTEGQEDAA